MRWVALITVLCACGRDKAETPDLDDTGTPAPPPCDVANIDAFWPDEGLSPTSRDADLSLSFSGVVSEEGSALSLTDASGAEVAGLLSFVEGGAIFAPDELLAADTTFNWSATICDATASGTFSTGTYGDRADTADMADKAFAVDLTTATWVQPEGGEDLLAGFFSGVVLLGVEAADDTEIDLIAAVGEVVDEDLIQQDPCFATADFAPADFRNNPYASVGPTTLEVAVEGIPVPLHQVMLSGAFVNGGLEDGVLLAEADVRDMAESIGITARQACQYVELYTGIVCGECSDDGETYCVGMELHDVTGVEQLGVHVVPNETPTECTDG